MKYWRDALRALQHRQVPEGFPQYGYLLESEPGVVGVILLIFTEGVEGDPTAIRCNVSSWHVREAYRLHASPLISAALRFKGVTYLNVSPAPHTWPMLEAQGYKRYAEGQYVSFPALSLNGCGARVRVYRPRLDGIGLPEYEAALLKYHQACGCLVLMVQRGLEVRPLVFLPRKLRGVAPVMMQLVYCRSTTDFTENAGPVGRFLARRGIGIVICDVQSPIRGLVGRYFKDRAPKYFKGADRPRLNDLAYTEAVLFGA